MSKAIQSAKSLLGSYEVCVNALNGALHLYLDGANAMTIGELKRFKGRATQISLQSYTELSNQLQSVATQIAREARLRAYSDAKIKAPNIIVTTVDLDEIDESVKQEFIKAALEGTRLAKDLMSQYTLLVTAYRSNPNSARIRIRERNRGRILKTYSYDRQGRASRTSWALYLKLAQFLSELSHMTYLQAAAELGFTTFELYQPDHRRHGMTFELESIPTSELHPQSEAIIKIKRGE